MALTKAVIPLTEGQRLEAMRHSPVGLKEANCQVVERDMCQGMVRGI